MQPGIINDEIDRIIIEKKVVLTFTVWAQDDSFEDISNRIIQLLHQYGDEEGFRIVFNREQSKLYDQETNAYGISIAFSVFCRRESSIMSLLLDHGDLQGLDDDDHILYYNAIRLNLWAGSTNITTLGTIGTGVWNGTALTAGYVPDHDNLNGFVGNEHIDHSEVNISAGGILSGGGDITASRTLSLVHSDVDHDQITNTHNLTTDIDHDQLTNFVANEHIDWTNASNNFLTTGTLGAGNTTIDGQLIVDYTNIETLLVRSNADSGDVFIVDTTNDHVYFGDRSNIVDLSWRLTWGGGDTTTGVFFEKAWKRTVYDACALEYKASFYGYSNNLVGSNPGGYQFYSRWNDAKSSFNRVSLTFQSLDTSNLVVGNYYLVAEQNGDFAIGHTYTNSVLIIDYTTKNLKITDGKNIITGSTTGTKIGTATTQKLGFWNATPVVKPTVTGAKGGNVALTNLLTALANMGLIVDSTS